MITERKIKEIQRETCYELVRAQVRDSRNTLDAAMKIIEATHDDAELTGDKRYCQLCSLYEKMGEVLEAHENNHPSQDTVTVEVLSKVISREKLAELVNRRIVNLRRGAPYTEIEVSSLPAQVRRKLNELLGTVQESNTGNIEQKI